MALNGENSLLQTFVAASNAKRQNQELAFQQENNKALLKQHQQEIDEIAKTHQDDLNIRKAVYKQIMEQHMNETMGNQDAPMSALPTPNPQTSFVPGQDGGPPQAQISDPGATQDIQPYTVHPNGALGQLYPEGLTRDPGMVPRQNADAFKALMMKANAAAAQKGMEAQAETPEIIKRKRDEQAGQQGLNEFTQGETNKRTLATILGENTRESSREANALKVANTTGGYTLAGHRISAAATLGAARLRQQGGGLDPQELSSLIDQASTGDIDLGNGPKDMIVKAAIKSAGRVPFTAKQATPVKNFNGLTGIIDDMERLTNALPDSDSKIGAMLRGFGIDHSPYPSDMKNLSDQVSARAPEIVRNVFGIGSSRVTGPEITAALKGMATGKVTKSQARDNLTNIQTDAVQTLMMDRLGGQPFEQKVANLKKYGLLDKVGSWQYRVSGNKTIPMVMRDPKSGKLGLYDPAVKKYGIIE